MTENLEKLAIRSIKLIRIEPSNIEEEGSNIKGLDIRAVRGIKSRST